MFCKNCGKEINDQAEICIHCGVRAKQESIEDTGSTMAALASCCFPIVGLVLYFVWKDNRPKSAKQVCHGALIGVGLVVLLYVFLFLVGISV